MNPLVLSEALTATDATASAGQRIHDLLLPFLDPATFTAVGVVHGKNNSAAKAYRRAKNRLFEKRGLVWLNIDSPLVDVVGDRADDVVAAFAALSQKTMTFYAVLTGRVDWALTKNRLLSGHIDRSFIDAGLDR